MYSQCSKPWHINVGLQQNNETRTVAYGIGGGDAQTIKNQRRQRLEIIIVGGDRALLQGSQTLGFSNEWWRLYRFTWMDQQ